MNTREKFATAFANLPKPDLSGPVPVSQQVSEYLTVEILSGQLAPGTALSENSLCTFFDVSRQPVREALLRLSTTGLVQVYAQRGSVVSRISVDEVRRAQFIREVIEVETVQRAIAASTPTFVQALRAEIDLQRMFLTHGDTQRFYASDEAFHRLIAEQSGVPRLWDELTALKAQLDRVRHLQLKEDQPLESLTVQHEVIVNAIDQGDTLAAAEAMRSHLRLVTVGLDSTARALPHFFED